MTKLNDINEKGNKKYRRKKIFRIKELENNKIKSKRKQKRLTILKKESIKNSIKNLYLKTKF